MLQGTASVKGVIERKGGKSTTSADGAFDLTVAGPGEFSIRVYADQGSQYFFDVVVPAGGGDEFYFELPTACITGSVSTPTADPLPRISVTLQVEQPEGSHKTPSDSYRRTYTNAEGVFDFRFLEAGSYTLRSPDGHWFDSPLGNTPYGRVVLGDLLVGEGEFV